jgi:predicted DNA-binding WGR domain protein
LSNVIRVFNYQDDKSSKFWEITQSGVTVMVRFGKIGTQGQRQEKTFAEVASAAKHAAKLIAEKTAKGYVERGGQRSDVAEAFGAPAQTTEQGSPGAAMCESVSKISDAAKTPKISKASKPKSPVRGPEATPESLLALLDQDDATNRLLARHPRASGELLEKLSHSSDKATRQAVAQHPNTPKEALVALAPQFPGEFYKNPAFDWLLLEDPDLLFRMGEGVLKNILKREDCPLSFMQWAVQRGSAIEQQALAMNPNVPPDILARLAKRKGAVSSAARGRQPAKDVGQSVESLAEEIEQAYRSEVIKALASIELDDAVSAFKRGTISRQQLPWLSLECRVALSGIPWAAVVVGVLPGREEELAGSAAGPVRMWVARFVGHGTGLLERLAKDRHPLVRAAVAANAECPPPVLTALVDDPDFGVRTAAARNPQLTAEQAERLAETPSTQVRLAVCDARRLPLGSLQALAKTKRLEVRKPALSRLKLLGHPAANPNTPTEQLLELAKSSKVSVKAQLAANPSTPAEVLERLAAEAHPALDEELLCNPNLPYDVSATIHLRQLEGGKSAVGVLEHERTPFEIRRLAAEKVWRNRWPRTEDWIQDVVRFFLDPTVGVDLNNLLHVPDGMESVYAASTLRSARLLGLAHPKAPVEALIKRSSSVDWVERLAIARNTSTPPNLITKLGKDPHRFVATQAQATELAKIKIAAQQEEALAQTVDPVDWTPVASGLLSQLRQGGNPRVRPWQFAGTRWWPELPLISRMGLIGADGMELPLDRLFAGCPNSLFGRMSSEGVSESVRKLRGWLLNSESTPVRVLETIATNEMFNTSAKQSWLTRVPLENDPELVTKLRSASDQTQQGQPWHGAAKALLGHPDLPEDCAQSVRDNLLRAHQQKLRTRLVGATVDARLQVAADVEAPRDVLEALAKDKNKEVRLIAELACWRFNPPPSDAERQKALQGFIKRIQSAEQTTKQSLAALDLCPPEVLTCLADDADWKSVVVPLMLNPSTPLPVFLMLSSKFARVSFDFQDLSAVFAQPVGGERSKALRASKSEAVRALVARWAPQDDVAGLERDPSFKVRMALAQRRVDASRPKGKLTLPPEVCEALARDLDPLVRAAMVARPDLPTKLREQLADDHDPKVSQAACERGGFSQTFYAARIRAGVLYWCWVKEVEDEATLLDIAATPERTLLGFNLWGYSSAAKALLGRGALPASVQHKLARDPQYRRELSERKDVPLDLLIQFLNDADPSVFEAALESDRLPLEVLSRVVTEKPSKKGWMAVFKNPYSPTDLVELAASKLGAVDSYEHRLGNRSWYALKLAGASSDEQIRAFLRHAMNLAFDAKTPLDVLRSLAACGFWSVRKALAENSVLPLEERESIVSALWKEMEQAFEAVGSTASEQDLVDEDEVAWMLGMLDFMPPPNDKRAIAAAAKSPQLLQRIAAALSPGVQPSILKFFLDDSSQCVRSLAAQKLRALSSQTHEAAQEHG